MPKKLDKKGKADIHEDLSGFNIKIDAFGSMQRSLEIDKINEFLDKNVHDKKLHSEEE